MQVTTGASSDFNKATHIATSMVRNLGMSDKIGVRVFDDVKPKPGSDLAKAIDAEIKQLLDVRFLDILRNILHNTFKQHLFSLP